MPTSPFDYLKALILCVIAAGVYEQAIAPQLVGDKVVTEIPILAPSTTADVTLLQYFRPGSWQTDNPMQIETEIGVLLFKKWERKSDTLWKLSPVTLLLRDDDEPEASGDAMSMKRPILLEAPGGAEIEFAESLEVIDGDTPPVTSGRLIGNVQLFGPATKADGSDRLQINASDVRINGKKIWTTAPVRVQIGAAVAEGRDLTIALSSGGNLRTEQAKSPLSILNELSLIYVDRVQLPIPEGSLWPPVAEVLAARNPGSIPPAGTPGMVTVRCGGALRFDFTTYTLSLNDQVTIEHAGAGLPVDTLRCPTVTIELEDPFGNSVANPTPDRMIRRIRAFGGDVIVDAPTLLTRARAELIDADFHNGQIDIKSAAGIEIVHRALQLMMSDFQYRFTPGELTDMIQLKTVGPGQLIAHDPKLPLRSFQWKEQLRITPERDPNKYQLWLLHARAVLPDDGRIETDDLRFGFYIHPKEAAPQGGSSDGLLGGRFQPQNIVAKGNVLFDTREVLAEVEQLDLFIEQVIPGSEQEKQLSLNRASGADRRRWAREPQNDVESTTGLANQPNRASSRARPRITGQSLSANILTDGRDVLANELSINQNVRLEHQLESDQGPTKVVLTGTELIYVEGDQGQVIQVSGAPAQVAIGDGFFRGPMVQLRMGENLLFMDRAGEFQLPTSMLSSATTSNSPPQFRWIAPPRCVWKGQMQFNGQIARLVQGVNFSGAVATLDEPSRWDFHVGCELLEVSLRQRVNFASPESASSNLVDKVALKSIDGNGNVVISAVQRDFQGQLLGSHQMHVPTIELYPQNGDVRGSGPGWYHMWSKPTLDEDSPLAAIAKTGGWLAAHLIYQEAIEGNLNNKVLAFVRGVRLATAPVANEQQRIDANRIVEAQMGQAVLDCERLEFFQTPASHQFERATKSLGAWEVRASSSVAFQGRNENGYFRGFAERVGYTADKDLFVVEGTRNRPAELFRIYSDGTQGGNLKAYELKFKPRTFELSNLRLHSFNPGDLQKGFGIPANPTGPAAAQSAGGRPAPRF